MGDEGEDKVEEKGDEKEKKVAGGDIEEMSVTEIAAELKELTFEIKDRTIDLPMGDKTAVLNAFGPLLKDYCEIVPKVAAKVQDYFKKNQVPIEMIKATDVYYYELKRAMRKNPEVMEDDNLKKAVEMVVTPYEKVIKTMVDIARQYAKQRGTNYDSDY